MVVICMLNSGNSGKMYKIPIGFLQVRFIEFLFYRRYLPLVTIFRLTYVKIAKLFTAISNILKKALKHSKMFIFFEIEDNFKFFKNCFECHEQNYRQKEN